MRAIAVMNAEVIAKTYPWPHSGTGAGAPGDLRGRHRAFTDDTGNVEFGDGRDV
ncbi:hypothetical protein [Rhodococcus sp. T7]|uniref:hypothetical protein n=1 Tax=Rhodococcus sp. T7 TaxID=627444 RepID=UPI00135A8AD7|nr:hypothetical protein [Rhodococcus sp. T7]